MATCRYPVQPAAARHCRDDGTTVASFLREVRSSRRAALVARRRWHTIRATATSLLDEPGIEGIAIVLRDDDRSATLADLPGEPALRDALTGLASRALFHDRVEHALNRARRLQQPLAVVLLEFDDFRANGVRATYQDWRPPPPRHAGLRASVPPPGWRTRFGLLLEDMRGATSRRCRSGWRDCSRCRW